MSEPNLPPQLPVPEVKTSPNDETSSQASSTSKKPSGIKPPSASRIGRPCLAHSSPKAGPPPLEQKSEKETHTMRRQSDDMSKSHLADVYEECEADLVSERRSTRSSKSKSPDNVSWKPPKSDRKVSNGSMSSELYWEATGRRKSSDQGVVLTADTDSFIIGQKVWVGGIRPGHIAYIGETHFAPGDWAGIVLDEPNGKNDGCVAGKRYFQCEPKKGIFSRLTRLTKEQLPGATSSDDVFSLNHSTRSLTSPLRSGTVSPTTSMKNSTIRTPGKNGMAVGDRVIVSSGFGSRPGILKYIGETKFAPGNWCGVQLDDPTGKNDGSVGGHRYFECPDNYGIFVPLAKITLSPSAKKITRLSRAGSKESLTSVGTLGSVASTATSRLRMSAQRLSSSAKPLTTPKNSFSLQDVLREKQSHIEQLLVEKDLDRQDAENQVLMYQKDINQLKEKIVKLDKLLESEKKRNDELQMTVEEATFCGDELSAQTQEYKERIVKLEEELSKIGGSAGIKPTAEFEDSGVNKEIIRLQLEVNSKNVELQAKDEERKSLENEIEQLHCKLNETENSCDIKISSLSVSEQCLQEEIKYLSSQIDELREELRRKDEINENQYITMRANETALQDEIAALQSTLEVEQSKVTEGESDLQVVIREKDDLIKKFIEDEKEIRSLHESNNNLLKEKDAELKTMQENLSHMEEQFKSISSIVETLKTDERKYLESIEHSKAGLQKRDAEIHNLQIEYENVAKKETELKKVAEIAGTEVAQLAKENADFKMLIENLQKTIRENETTISQLKEKDDLIANLTNELQKIKDQVIEISKTRSSFETDILAKDKEIENNELLITALQTELKELGTINHNFKTELTDYKVNIENADVIFKKLNTELAENKNQILEKCSELENTKKSLDAANKEIEILNVKIKDSCVSFDEANKELNHLLESTKHALQIKEQEYEQLQINHLKQCEILISEKQQLQTNLDKSDVERKIFEHRIEEYICSTKIFEDKIGEQNRDIQDLRQTNEALNKTLQEKQSQMDKTNAQQDELISKLKSSEQENVALQDRFDKTELENGDLERKLMALDQKTRQITEQKNNLQQELELLRNSSLDSNSELLRFQEELQAKQKAYAIMMDSSVETKNNLEKQLQEITQKYNSKTQFYDKLKQETENIIAQKIDRENELNVELEKIKEHSENEKQSLQDEIKSMRLKYEEEKNLLLSEINDKLESSAKSKLEMDNSITVLEESVRNLKQNLEQTDVQASIKEKEFIAKLNELEFREKQLTQDIDLSMIRAEEYKHVLAELKLSNKAQNDELHLEISSKIDLINELELKLESEINTNKSTEAELFALREQITLKSNENATLQEQTKLLTSEKDQLTELTADLKIKNNELTIKHRRMEDEQVNLVNKNENLIFKLTTVSEELEKLKIANEDLVRSYDGICNDLNKKVEKLIEDNELNVKTLTDEKLAIETMFEDKIKQLTSSVNLSDDLKNELCSKSEQLKSKEQYIQELISNLESLKISINEKDIAYTKLISDSESIHGSLKDEIKTKAEIHEELQKTFISLEKNLYEKTAELEIILHEKETQKSSYIKETEQLNEQILSQDIELKDLKKQIQTNLNQITELKQKLLLHEGEAQKLLEYSQKSTNYSTELINLQNKYETMEKFKADEVEQLLIKMKDYETIIKGLEAKIAKQSSDQENLSKLFKKKEAELMILNKKIENLEAEDMSKILNLRKEIDTLKTNVKDKDVQIKVINSKFETIKNIQQSNVKSSLESEEVAQIDFLNSIIADMQKKNETLMARVQSLEAGPADLAQNPFSLDIKRKPAPRLFCDICDIFDAHDTEECPLQCSDSSSPIKEPGAIKVLPEPRKYCESCEVFGHEIGECDNDETY